MGKKVGKKQGLPKGWQEVRLGEVFMLSRGRVISKKEIQSNSGIFPVYSSKTYDNGKLGSINTYDFDGDYLTWTTDGANAGSVFYRKGKFNCTNVCGVAKSMYPDRIDCQFVSYFLQDKTQKYVSYVGNPKLMNNTFAEIMIQFPPFLKQKAIASLLETWDTAIEKTEALIAAKEKQFKWLIEFSINRYQCANMWDEYTLGDLFDIYTYSSKNRGIDKTGEQFIVDMGAISRNGDLIASKRTKSSQDILQVNDLVMPKDDIGGGNIIGKAAIIGTAGRYVCGDHVYRLVRKKENDAHFLKFLINCPHVNKQLRARANGTAQLGLSKRDVSKQKVAIPSFHEQKSIARILKTTQQEIDTLKKIAEKYRIQKRGLMQKLLTGEWKAGKEEFSCKT